ncbi:hypothetical protein Val02_30080 [Virgisporangium aliadipatigenens]|uniref:Uncharacterized protein n=1 Tax=Virgisporangium aliadipatigenens TaxID=741659 RepID=A0A8J4DRA0_9ACTN|nr:hypothetical protein [Virgisporangium aliadipatigenens]GIJ46122.1 hypothetical protein Val02_30080 [Virgisporangium aliadipatigenens]
MPFAELDVRIGLACGPDATGRWRGHYALHVAADALRKLGLHPDQPTAAVGDATPPAWWHAAAERSWHRSADRSDEPRPMGEGQGRL